MTAFFNVVGTLEEFRQAFTITVVIGRSSSTHSLRRKVGIGSNVQDFVAELKMIFRISSGVVNMNFSRV